MLRGVKLAGEIKPVDPNRSVSEAILETGRRTDASNKALIEAVKGILVKAPEVQVAAPQVKVQMPATAKPTKWTFTVERDGDGLMTSITATAG